MTCCTRRREDGHIDRVEVENAVQGRTAKLTPTEARLVVWKLAQTNGWGLRRISAHTGYSQSRVAAILAQTRATR